MIQTYKTCPKCGQSTAPQADACPDCGHHFPTLSDDSSATTNLTMLVCPNCFARDGYLVDQTQPLQILTCSRCHSGFASRIVLIRGKTTRQSRPKNCRYF